MDKRNNETSDKLKKNEQPKVDCLARTGLPQKITYGRQGHPLAEWFNQVHLTGRLLLCRTDPPLCLANRAASSL